MSLIPILAEQLRLCPLIRVLYSKKHRLLTRTSWTTNRACEDSRERQPSLEQLQPPPAADIMHVDNIFMYLSRRHANPANACNMSPLVPQ